MLSTYLFDFDGTLVDSVPLILESYRHATQQELGVVYPDEAYKRVIGLRLSQATLQLVGDEEKAERVMRAYVEHNMRVAAERMQPYPGTVEVLTELEARGARTAVVTSKRRAHVLLALQTTGLDRFFSVVVAAEDVQDGKPDPEGVQRALATLEVPADSAVMIGDSSHDVQAGRSAGTQTAFVTWGAGSLAGVDERQVDWVCDRVEQLLNLS